MVWQDHIIAVIASAAKCGLVFGCHVNLKMLAKFAEGGALEQGGPRGCVPGVRQFGEFSLNLSQELGNVLKAVYTLRLKLFYFLCTLTQGIVVGTGSMFRLQSLSGARGFSDIWKSEDLGIYKCGFPK